MGKKRIMFRRRAGALRQGGENNLSLPKSRGSWLEYDHRGTRGCLHPALVLTTPAPLCHVASTGSKRAGQRPWKNPNETSHLLEGSLGLPC